MHIKVEITVRRVVKGKLEKARFYAVFRVSQSLGFKKREDDLEMIKNMKF